MGKGDNLAKGKNAVYDIVRYSDKVGAYPIESIDIETFAAINNVFFKDKENIYCKKITSRT